MSTPRAEAVVFGPPEERCEVGLNTKQSSHCKLHTANFTLQTSHCKLHAARARLTQMLFGVTKIMRLPNLAIPACVLLLAFALALPATAMAQNRFTDSDADAVKTFLHAEFATGNSGMVIGLVDKDGSQVFGVGKLDNGTDQEVNGDTVFQIDSVTKVFTALLALELAQRGEFKLDDPVAEYCPPQVKIPAFEGQNITIRNLAAQDSGLPWNPAKLEIHVKDSRSVDAFKAYKKAADEYTADDLYAFLGGYKLTSAPRTQFQYSNVGMALLGNAMERKTGQSYESLVVERICRPLKMDSTCITLTPELQARLARGHWADGQPAENGHYQALVSAGSLLSTANDLLKFMSANLGFTETELSPMLEEMQVVRHTDVPKFGTTAMPWFDERVHQFPGSKFFAHSGGGLGYLTFIGFDKLQRRGVVVLSNQLAVNPSGVGYAILQGMPLNRQNVGLFVREVVGIGTALETDEESGSVRITRVFPDSPAANAGLSPGLMIRTVNKISVKGKTLPECLRLVGGPLGSGIRLELFDPQRKETKVVELTRQRFLTTTSLERRQ